MKTKKDAVSEKTQTGKTTPKAEVKILPAAAQTANQSIKQPTVEELQKRVLELQGKLSSIPQNLNDRIDFFTKKQDLIRKLGRLDANKENLSIHLDSLSEIAASNEFENEEYFLNIEAGRKYSKKAIFSLQNPLIIGEVISFIMGRIDVKREELQKAIEA